jgi:gluconate 5-dehydrogenase
MQQNLFDLSGRIALVTGSGRGLGLGIARGLAGHGATVVLNDLDDAKLEKAVAIMKDEGADVRTQIFNVTDQAAVVGGIEAIEHDVGPIEILVNNAGIQRRHPLEQFPEDEWRQVIEMNLTSPFIVSKAAAKGMIARRRGKIINVCSLNSEVSRVNIAAYTSAKGGLRMLTKSMALEWAKYNIQTNAIGPGYFDTEMTEALVKDPEFNAFVLRRTPQGRWGTPADLAGVAVFLASQASDYVNGQLIFVDGGMLTTI